MNLVNCKRLKSAFCLVAAVLILCGNLFSVPALSVQAASVDSVVIPDYTEHYTLSYSVMCAPACGTSYYHHYNVSVISNTQLFLYLHGDPEDAVSTQYSVNVGLYDAENQKVYGLTQSGAKNFDFYCDSYTDITYSVSTGALYRTTTITDGTAAVGLYCSKVVHKTSLCSYICNGYVFESEDAALAYFAVGDTSGLINEPVPQPDPDEDDPTLDLDYDPDSFYGKVLEMLRKVIFGDWSFTKFLNLFSLTIFKDWSFTKFLQLFQQTIFGSWSFESFKKIFSGEIFVDWKFSDLLDMIYTAMFGSSSVQPTNFWEFLRSCLFGSVQKYTDFFGFLEDAFRQVKEFDYAGFWASIKEQLSGLSFEKIRDIINAGFFGSLSKYENIWDYFDEKFGLSGIDYEGICGVFVELVKTATKTAVSGDWKSSLFGILFVPDDEVMQEMWADIQDQFSGIFGLMNSGNHIVDFLKTCSGLRAPNFTVNLGSSASYYLGNETVTIDFSWYAPYKPTVDLLFAGIIWAGFIWRMYSRIPEIIGGVGMAISMPYRLEHIELQNERIKETRYRSDVRWSAFLSNQSRRRR